MKKAIIIPDSFKGTLTSRQICHIISEKIKVHFPQCEIISLPVADGGEGSDDCFLSAMGGERIPVTVKNPYMEDIETYYGLIDQGKTAIIEMASCAGLPLVENRKNPLVTTTYGVGQLILAAADRGVKKMIVGLGGSATNDGGCGAAAAVGIKFINAQGEAFIPVGGTLHEIHRIDPANLSAKLRKIAFVTMCDIDNPMYGPGGAAQVFAPQKGANPEMVSFLDQGIKHLAQVIKTDLGQEVSDIPGTGAAGAMGAGMIAFFASQLQMGIETVLDTVNFNTIVSGADMIFTGEGKIDHQSLRGKVVIGVSRRAKEKGIPVIALVGGASDHIDGAYDQGVTAIFSINRLPEDFSVSRYKSAENLGFTVDNLLRLIKAQSI